MHAHAVPVGDEVPVEGLGLCDVRARVGAPHLADGAHRTGPLAEQRRVGFPVHLFVFEADEGDRGVGTRLERASFPAIDEVGAVIAGLARFRHLHAADHPATACGPSVLRRRHGQPVTREAVLGLSLLPVRVAHRAGEVRPVAGVAAAELFGIALGEAVAVDPLVGVGVALVIDVAVFRVESAPAGAQEQIHVRRRRAQRVDDRDLAAVPVARALGRRMASRRAWPGVGRHEHDLVVVVERSYRIRSSRRCSAGTAWRTRRPSSSTTRCPTDTSARCRCPSTDRSPSRGWRGSSESVGRLGPEPRRTSRTSRPSGKRSLRRGRRRTGYRAARSERRYARCEDPASLPRDTAWAVPLPPNATTPVAARPSA